MATTVHPPPSLGAATTKPRVRRPRHIIELERIAADPSQLPQHRLRAATSLARALPKPKPPREPPRRLLTPAMATHIRALCAALGTSWEEHCPSATWEELAAAGYDRHDVIAAGVDPELVQHGPPVPPGLVLVPELDED